MSKFYISIVFTLSIVAMLLASCSDNVTESSKVPVILSVEPAAPNPGDIITIWGADLGYNPSNGVVHIADLTIPFSETIKWNNSFIRLQLPLSVKTGMLFIILDNDSSNVVNITINDKPAIEFIDVPAGEFMMGSDRGFGYEQPVHLVKITSPFSLSKFEITQKLWRLVMNNNPSSVQADNLPVMNIEWADAISFCNKLSAVYGLDSVYIFAGNTVIYNTNASGFRLPTEAEWEYACRAGSDTDYPGSGILDDMGWYNANSGYNPHSVGSKQPNALGLYDMNGNVWEWCWDWYDDAYYSVSPTNDPKGPMSGDRRVLRGGSCSDGATFARSSNRTYLAAEFINCGFRIARKTD